MNTFIIIRNIVLNADERWSEMADLGKVIYDIERCICHVPDACKDCSKYGGDNAIRCMEELLTDALSLLKAQEPGWISVKDRLPDAAGVPVLVTAVNTYGQKDVFEAFMGYGDFKWYTENVMRMSKKTDISCEVSEAWTITHWMPCSEPPKEET